MFSINTAIYCTGFFNKNMLAFNKIATLTNRCNVWEKVTGQTKQLIK